MGDVTRWFRDAITIRITWVLDKRTQKLYPRIWIGFVWVLLLLLAAVIVALRLF